MTDEQTRLLLNAIEQKKKSAISLAQMLAMEFVATGDVAKQARAKVYIEQGDLWQEAWNLINSARCGRLPEQKS